MNQEILKIGVFVLTPMKAIALAGVIMFSGRWFVQMYASKKAGKPVIPRAFWYLSLIGTLCQLAYWIFGKNDSVGIISTVFPAIVALYNLTVDKTQRPAEA